MLTVETPATPVWVQGDATRLAQAVDNLLDNAGKFTERDGQVVVRLAVDEGAESQAHCQGHRQGHRAGDAWPRVGGVHAGDLYSGAFAWRAGPWPVDREGAGRPARR